MLLFTGYKLIEMGYEEPGFGYFLNHFGWYLYPIMLLSLYIYFCKHIKTNKIRRQKIENAREEYFRCLKSKDKTNSVYWGKLFYEYDKCFTIHQQNNIHLQIQNDILSHS
jgi:hypothetical protein